MRARWLRIAELMIVVVKARDRPGLLQDAAGVLRQLGLNIVSNVGYAVNGEARILFIVECSRDPGEVAEALEERLEADEAEVVAGKPGPDIADELAELVAERPILISALEPYLAPADLLGVILRIPEEDRGSVYRLLSIEGLSRILAEADEQTVGEIAGSVGYKWLARVLEHMDSNKAVDVLQALDSRTRREVMASLPGDYRAQLSRLLAYPPMTAGGMMTASVPVLAGESTVQDALAALKVEDYDVRDVIVVVDGEGRLVGLIPVSDLFLHGPNERLGKLAVKPRAVVTPMTDREDAARIMLRYGLNRLPVVDERGVFLGILMLEDVARVVAEEAAEDIAKLGGIMGGLRAAERYAVARIMDLVRGRLPWLLLIYAIESVTANVLKGYKDVIEGAALVAAFIPLIMGTGGNVGSQAASLILRSLALGEISEASRRDIARVILKELAVSAVMAVAIGGAGFLFALAVSGSTSIASAVALTLAAVTVVADLIGAMLPVIARRAGVDPAALSAPLLATIIDVSVAFLYMAIAARLVLGLG